MQAEPGLVARSRTVLLPEALDARVAATLAGILADSHDEDLVLDASYVRKLDADCEHLLRDALQASLRDHRSLKLVNGPAAMAQLS